MLVDVSPPDSPASKPAVSRPNVIWVFGDQHRRQMLGCMGDPNVRTPNIDTLSEYGINFPHAVTNFPLCCPARGTLLTGKHAHNCIPGHDHRMPEGSLTLADVFRENGYRTAWFGKWHVDGWIVKNGDKWEPGERREIHPQAPKDEPGIEWRETHRLKPREARGGFQTWVGYENNNSPHNTWVHGHDENGEELDHHRLDGFETDALTDKLIDYLRRRADDKDPFFASLSVQPPHDPYAAPEQFMGNYNPARMIMRENVPNVGWVQDNARREYAGACAMVENLDWNLGRIRKVLHELGLETNTHIIFFSDHGDMHGSHGMFHKTNPYEESVGVPMIMGGALDVQGEAIRRRLNHVISLVDLAPTTLGLCGIEAPDWMQGYNYAPFKLARRGEDLPKDADVPDAALIQLVIPTRHGNSTDRAWRGVVTRDGWKYVCFENTDWLMFNLKNDALEQVNLAHNTVVKAQRDRLRQRLRDLLVETGDSFAVPTD